MEPTALTQKQQLIVHARSALADMHHLEPRLSLQRRLLIRLWEYPSFTAWKTWGIFAPHARDTAYVLRQAIWDQPSDLQPLFDPMAHLRRLAQAAGTLSMTVHDLALAEVEVLMYEAPLRQDLPLFVEQEYGGVDGIHFGLERPGLLSSFCLEWWNEGPRNWQSFIQKVATLREEVAKRFEAEEE